jgi:mannitol/fructose-specific phosphotransferase system IIA component (Ntr-type)
MSTIEPFRSESVLLDLSSELKSAVLEEMIAHAVTNKLLPSPRKDQVLEIVTEREARGTTAFGGGIAMPHARVPSLRKNCGIVARSQDGIDFRAVDGEPVQVLVMLISPESRADEHLATLRWLSAAARDPDFKSFILQASTPEQVLDVLQERAP